jgi:hypothetical protein
MSALEEVREAFDRWLHLPDKAPLHAVLGAVSANRLPGDPVWLLLVGSPGTGKSETLQAAAGLPEVHPTGTLTEAALLSGTAAKERAQSAKGGLLREIGSSGVILCKDVGSILSMHREGRAQVLAALREVYDGSWTRHVGTEGGRTLHWQGKVGLIGGVTPTIDRHHGVMASLGERFLLLRMPPVDESEQARRAYAHAGRELEMRADLAAAVEKLFATGTPAAAVELEQEEIELLVSLSTFAVRCRSAVERDGYSRDIELIPAAEAPTRLIVVLRQFLTGLHAIGLDAAEAWRITRKATLDSIPAIRLEMIRTLSRGGTLTTSEIAIRTGYPVNTATRALEDLAAHKVLMKASQGAGKANLWALTDEPLSGGGRNEVRLTRSSELHLQGICHFIVRARY